MSSNESPGHPENHSETDAGNNDEEKSEPVSSHNNEFSRGMPEVDNKSRQKAAAADDAAQAEDNATSPDSYDDGEESYWTDDDGDYGDDDASYDPRILPEMPLLKYGRIVGSLPRLGGSDGRLDGADAGAGPGTGTGSGCASGGGAGGVPSTNSAPTAAADAATSIPAPAPAPLAVPVTCQCMGRVVLGPGARVYSSDAAPAVAASQTQPSAFTAGGRALNTTSATTSRSASGDKSSSSGPAEDDVTAKTRHVLALGFADGSVRVVDPISGVDIVPLGKLVVPAAGIGDVLLHRGGGSGGGGDGGGAVDTTKRIVAVSFDASGTFLAAINANGDAAVFELKYIAGDARATAAAQAGGEGATTNKDDHIAALLSAWKQQQQQYQQQSAQQPPAAAPDSGVQTDSPENKPESSLLGNLTVTLPIPTARFAYPRSTHSVPTCLVIDPTYRRRREKSVLVGFADGRLILTKRGMLFSRRSDSVIYQGVGGPSKGGTQSGIEAVTWRGCLVAWADTSGIKLFDIDDMIRIAHIDRPSGARASLYPSISSLRPTLLFERPHSLLVVWGDCILSMLVKERAGRSAGTTSGSGAEDSSGTAAPGSPTASRRRVVECSVAWELDCVACGAVPLDGKHWAVLGLVPKPPGDEDQNGEKDSPHDSLPTSSAGNLVELQIISRAAGTVVAADALPLVKMPAGSTVKSGVSIADAGIDFSLISSYCTARMDEALEVEEEELNGSVEDHDAQVAMYEALTGESTTSSSQQKQQNKFLDPHLKWSIDTIRFTEDDEELIEEEKKEETIGDDEEDDAGSVFSDDYNFLFRPAPTSRQANATKQIPNLLSVEPPTIVVASSRDLVLARTRDIDDAVAHARTAGMPGKALQIALRDTRMVRRHNLNRLIDDYLCALLRLREHSVDVADFEAPSGERNYPPLTVSRLRLAAKATPRLLGGHVEMWRKWIKEFSLIPGGLFVLREYLPVRDPKLPSKVYEMVLMQMLSELETMASGDADSTKGNSSVLHQDAADLFLKTLRSWGPTSSISERIKVHRMFSAMQVWHERSSSASDPVVEEAKADLQNRRHQTVVGYLQTVQSSSAQVGAAKQALDKTLDGASSSVSTSDSLFSIDIVRRHLGEKLNRLQEEDEGAAAADGDALWSSISGRVIAATTLSALSELDFMKGRHEESLKLQLAMGSKYSATSLVDLENEAVQLVNVSSKTVSPEEEAPSEESRLSYHHILGHVEYHHLHWCLLETQFLSSVSNGMGNGSNKDVPQSPIPALIRLVGLELSGRFLVDHCSLPRSTSATARRQNQASQSQQNRSQTLPLDVVAEQLRPTPKLLHWYLTQVFLHKPEVYVKFPNTAVPPRTVTDLHRTHLELHIKYAANSADKNRELADIPAYDDVNAETPLLMFLKAALPHGGTRPDDVRRMLEVYREGRTVPLSPGSPSGPISGVRHPHLFARELAYVIERCDSGTEDDSRTILQLYLEGAKSLPLAVTYAQRNKAHSILLWDSLVSYCLDPKPQLTRKRKGKRKDSAADKENGHLFGALLEVAARSGADLSHLVSKIPKGMQIEGLRPRLIASIADYRVKVQMHKAAADVLNKDKVDLLRELAQKSRRGTRIGLQVSGDDFGGRGTDPNGIGDDELESLTAKAKGNVKSLIEKKGDRLSVHPERTGIIRSKALAIR